MMIIIKIMTSMMIKMIDQGRHNTGELYNAM